MSSPRMRDIALGSFPDLHSSPRDSGIGQFLPPTEGKEELTVSSLLSFTLALSRIGFTLSSYALHLLVNALSPPSSMLRMS